jgi:hypothetical protein
MIKNRTGGAKRSAGPMITRGTCAYELPQGGLVELVCLLLIGLVICSMTVFGAEPPTVSQKRLDQMAAHWQHVLKLDDWEIRAHLVRLAELEPGTMANSHRDNRLKAMSMSVLDPRDYTAAAVANHLVPKTGREIVKDIENSVVHELVHLRLAELMQADDPGILMAEEVTVDRLTSALLAAH